MMLELLEESTPGSGTMYVVRNDGSAIKWFVSKAELQQSFSTCVYCMRLRFQSNYAGLSQPR